MTQIASPMLEVFSLEIELEAKEEQSAASGAEGNSNF